MPNHLITYVPSISEQRNKYQLEHAKTLLALKRDSSFYDLVRDFFSARDWLGGHCSYIPGSHISLRIPAQPERHFSEYRKVIDDLTALLSEHGYRNSPPSEQFGGYSREASWYWSSYTALKPALTLLVTLDLPETMAGLTMAVRTRTTTETSPEYIITEERKDDPTDTNEGKQQEAHHGFY